MKPRKDFPKESVDTLTDYLLKKKYSYREIQQIFKDVKGYTWPSLAYISSRVNKKKK